MNNKTYTKKDIAERISDKLNQNKNIVHEIVAEVFHVMREMLSEDSSNVRIEIRDFGTLSTKPTKAKPRARNPRTNQEIYVPAHRKTHFKPGKLLKSSLKEPLDKGSSMGEN